MWGKELILPSYLFSNRRYLLGRLHFLDGSEGKESACNAGDPGLIPELEISPGEGNGYPPQSSILAWKPHGQRSLAGYSPWSYKEPDTTEQLSTAQHVVSYFFSDIIWNSKILCMGFPGNSVGKESACNAGDLGSIPGLGRSPGEGKGYPLQYSGQDP